MKCVGVILVTFLLSYILIFDFTSDYTEINASDCFLKDFVMPFQSCPSLLMIIAYIRIKFPHFDCQSKNINLINKTVF